MVIISRSCAVIQICATQTTFPWENLFKEAHQRLVDKKSTKLSYGTNCWWLFNLNYPVPDQLGEFGLRDRLCFMQGDFLLWHIAGVAVERWRRLFFLTFTVKNILHFIQPDLCSTEVKYVITFFGYHCQKVRWLTNWNYFLLEESAEYVKLLLLIPFQKFDRWTVMHWQASLVICIKEWNPLLYPVMLGLAIFYNNALQYLEWLPKYSMYCISYFQYQNWNSWQNLKCKSS